MHNLFSLLSHFSFLISLKLQVYEITNHNPWSLTHSPLLVCVWSSSSLLFVQLGILNNVIITIETTTHQKRQDLYCNLHLTLEIQIPPCHLLVSLFQVTVTLNSILVVSCFLFYITSLNLYEFLKHSHFNCFSLKKKSLHSTFYFQLIL